MKQELLERFELEIFEDPGKTAWEVLEFIDLNYLKVNEMSDIWEGMGITQDQLRYAAAKMETTPSSLLKSRIIKAMKDDITVKHYTNKEILEKYGFNTYDALHGYFKHYTRYTLDQYRQLYYKDNLPIQTQALFERFGVEQNFNSIGMDRLALNIMTILDEIYTEKDAIAQIAKIYDTTVSLISKKFETRTGMRIRDAIMHRKRYQLLKYLECTDLSIVQICEKLGQSPKHVRTQIICEYRLTWQQLRLTLRGEENICLT